MRNFTLNSPTYLNVKFLKISILLLLSLIDIKNNKNINIYSSINNKFKLKYNFKFAIIQRNIKISTRGLMAYYFINMGCVIEYIYQGFIPIIDLSSHPNIFNGFNNKSNKNPWEIFFYQPFGYSLENVIKNAKNIAYFYCERSKLGPHFNIFNNIILINYWKYIAKTYIPIKEEFINEASKKYFYLLHRSKNVLGVLVRGTDYISYKPIGHPIQPSPEMVFEDIKKMDNKNNYDYIFLTTEDDLIREKFIKKLGKKLKYIRSEMNINYDYNKKKLLANNNNLKGNISFMKIYLINIIILSKCQDIITSRTGGSLVALLLTKGFRNIKIYYLGFYK